MSELSPLYRRALTPILGWLAFMDLALALLPISIIWNLRLDWHKKLGLSVLVGMGVFAFICAVIKTSKLPELNARADITFVTVSLWIWTANETNILILAASIPTLRPLYLILFNRPGSKSYRNKDFGRTRWEGQLKLGRTTAPSGITESVKVTGALDGDDRRLGLEQNRCITNTHGVFEVDV